MSQEEEKMSEKKESDSSDQTDHVSEESAVTESFNELRIMEDNETRDDGLIEEFVRQYFCDDDSIEELIRTLCWEQESNEGFHRYLRLKDEYNQIKASSNVSPDQQTDPESSKKDTTSIKTKPKEDINSLITKYFQIVENMKNNASLRLMKEKEIETEESKEEDCSKDTQTKTFPSLDRELESLKRITRKKEKLLLFFKSMLLLQVKKYTKELKEMMQQKGQKVEEKI